MPNNILIVDDDKRLRELLEDYLVEKKFEVFTSDDFASAKEVLKTGIASPRGIFLKK